jgi:hypothetical protein
VTTRPTTWGWASPAHPGQVTWLTGTLADTHHRVSYHSGPWVLVSSVPVSEYHRVMAAIRAAIADGVPLGQAIEELSAQEDQA